MCKARRQDPSPDRHRKSTARGTSSAVGATTHKEPWDAFWGMRYAELKDPDGTVLDLYAPLPEGH